MPISFSIPGKPFGWARVNPTARIVGEGSDARAISTMHDSKENKSAKAEAQRLYRIAAKGHQTISGPVRIKVVGVFDIPASWPRTLQKAAIEGRVWHTSKPDLDNIIKLILDALNKLAWADDSQVAIIEQGKRYGSPARIEVTISAIPQREDEITPAQRKLENRVAAEGWDRVLAEPARRKSPSKSEIPGRITLDQFRAMKGQPSRLPPKRRGR